LPNHRSAIARVKRTEKEHLRNKISKSRFRNLVKKIEKAIESSNKEEVRSLFPQAISAIDKAAKVGSIHKNQASRRKSRLTRHVNHFLNA